MSKHGTTSESFPGWYVAFQAAALCNLPRPDEIDKDIALGWELHGDSLKKTLKKLLVPPIASMVRDTGELTIEIPALQRPTLAELQEEHPLMVKWSIERIERDTSTTEAVTMRLGTVFLQGEAEIDEREYQWRLVLARNTLLGYQHAKWLIENQDKFPEFKASWMKFGIDFPGLVAVNNINNRISPYVCAGFGHQRWGMHLDYGHIGSISPGVRVAYSIPSASTKVGK